MEAFKVAFETVIVGLLALPWLLVAIHLLVPDFLKPEKWAWTSDFLPKSAELNATAFTILLVTLIYPLGSAVSRVASDFVDDDDWRNVFANFPTERAIQATVYCSNLPMVRNLEKELAKASHFADDSGDRLNDRWCLDTPAQVPRTADLLFHAQESTLFLEGEDKSEKVRQLREQLTILRGATVNLLILALLCFLGMWGHWMSVAQKFRKLSRFSIALLRMLPAVALTVPLARFLHYHGLSRLDDPPIMEGVVLGVVIIGVIASLKAAPSRKYWVGFAVAATCFVFIAAAWWRTTVDYTEQVEYSYLVGYGDNVSPFGHASSDK